MAHEDRVSSVAFSPDGTARNVDAASGAEIARLEHDKFALVVFSLDGPRLSTASWNGMARIIEGDTSMLFDRL